MVPLQRPEYNVLMKLRDLVQLSSTLRATPKKSEKVRLIAEFLRRTAGKETALAASYLTGTLPQGRIGIGRQITEEVLGGALLSCGFLTLNEVDRTFERIASERGSGSTDRRRTLLEALLRRADHPERRFLVDLLRGELRHGVLEGVVLDAVAEASRLPVADIRLGMMFCGNAGVVARTAIEEGAAGLSRFSIRLFSPISPMLAKSAADVEEALERLGKAAFEFKLDGARVQVHTGGGEVRIFTRQLQDITARLPELVESARSLSVREAILEGEVIALQASGRPHPFQVTMRCFGRVKDVEAICREIPLSYFFFDILYLDGKGVLALPSRERFEILAGIVSSSSMVSRRVTRDPQEAKRFLQSSFSEGHEGLMAKSLEAPYVAGQRGDHWLKIKGAKTLDLVVLGAEWGAGRRAGWLSNLHLGARDPQSGRWIMLGKTFKGLTDEILQWQTDKLLSLKTEVQGNVVFVHPELVVEIAFADLQQSPRYPAGIALRLARVKRYRTDKSPSEADTLQTVTEMFLDGRK